MKFDRKKFFDGFREHLDPTISQEQVDGLEFILSQVEGDPTWDSIPQVAYMLATVFHETAGSFQPVEEGYYLGDAAKVKRFQKKLRYYPHYGRGYVQLTWLANYKKASDELGIDFLKKPDLVMVPKNAYRIMTLGMHRGWFTGKKLDDFIKGGKKDYVNARTIINAHDKAGLIAGYAREFEKILKDSAVASAINLPNAPSDPSEQTEPVLQASNQDTANDSTPQPSTQIADTIVNTGDSTPPSPLPQIDPVVVQKEQVSLFAKIGAGITFLIGIGFNVGSFIQTKLEQMTPYQMAWMVGMVAFAALGIYWYQRAAKGAQNRTMQLVDKAADPALNTVQLTEKAVEK